MYSKEHLHFAFSCLQIGVSRRHLTRDPNPGRHNALAKSRDAALPWEPICINSRGPFYTWGLVKKAMPAAKDQASLSVCGCGKELFSSNPIGARRANWITLCVAAASLGIIFHCDGGHKLAYIQVQTKKKLLFVRRWKRAARHLKFNQARVWFLAFANWATTAWDARGRGRSIARSRTHSLQAPHSRVCTPPPPSHQCARRPPLFFSKLFAAACQ